MIETLFPSIGRSAPGAPRGIARRIIYWLGAYNFHAGAGGNVLIRTTGTTQTVVIDAIGFVKQ